MSFFPTFHLQVKVYPLSQHEHGADDVLVLGTDGLWDVLSNQEVAEAVTGFLANCDPDDHHRHVHSSSSVRPELPLTPVFILREWTGLSCWNASNFQAFLEVIPQMLKKILWDRLAYTLVLFGTTMSLKPLITFVLSGTQWQLRTLSWKPEGCWRIEAGGYPMTD